MLEPKPQPQPAINAAASSSSNPPALKRSVSAPQPRQPAAAAAVPRPAIHQYAFGQGGAVFKSQSGPVRLSQLERGATGLSQLSATARGKLREVVPDSQVLEEPGLPASGGAASRFFGGVSRRSQAVLAKASSDEPRSSNRSLLTDHDGPASARASLGSVGIGDGVSPSHPARQDALAIGVAPSSPFNVSEDDDGAGGSDISLTPNVAISVASSPSPRKSSWKAATSVFEDVLSSPANANRFERERSSSIGRSISDGYISSSPASAVGRTASGSPSRGRDLIGTAIDEAQNDSEEYGPDVEPSSDATVTGLDLRQICESSPPLSARTAEEAATAEKRALKLGQLKFHTARPGRGTIPRLNSSPIQSPSDRRIGDGARSEAASDDADDGDESALESEAAAEADRQRKQAQLGIHWREKFSLKPGPGARMVRLAIYPSRRLSLNENR